MSYVTELDHFPADVVALKLGVSIGIGMLIGFEREWSNKDVGIRTFALISISGMLSVLVSPNFSLGLLGGILVLIAFMNVRSLRTDNTLEITTSAAVLVVYILGVLVGHGHMFTPVASCILVAMLLAWKTELHRLAGGVRPDEIRSAILLGLIGFVIYPILPNEFVDPWHLLNPRSAWVIVVAVAGISFVNYVLLRLYSNRGLYWSAVLGGMVNSTATIMELANTLRASEGLMGMLVALDLLTVIAMFARNLLLLAIFARPALHTALAPILCMAGVAVLLVRHNARRISSEPTSAVGLSSPLSLKSVLELGALFLAIETTGTLGTRMFGQAGMVVVSLFGGLVSSASTTAAAASMSSHGKITPAIAGIATVLTCVSSAIINVPLIWKQTRKADILRQTLFSTLAIVLVGLFVLGLVVYVRW